MKLFSNTRKCLRLRCFAVFVLMTTSAIISAQSINQMLSGKVIEKESQKSVPGVELIIKNSDPLIIAKTDEQGNFKFENLPEGIYYIQLSSETYDKTYVNKVNISAGNNFICFELSKSNPTNEKGWKFKLKDLLAILS